MSARTRTRGGGGHAGERLRLRLNPIRLVLSLGPWVGAWYLLSYLAVGWVLFAVVFTIVSATSLLAVTLAGLPLLIAAAGVIRGCANVERGRLRAVFAEPVRGRYRKVSRPGIMAQVATRWRDPATWRDIAYLLGLFVPLVVLDFAVLGLWLIFLAGVTLPAWYWTAKNTCIGYCAGPQPRGVPFGYFPHGPHGPGASGLYVDTLPKALLAAAGFLILFLIFNYILVAAARAHARAARALLRAPSDPLAEARELLSRPGPLPPLMPTDS